jgi:hypothetical protein
MRHRQGWLERSVLYMYSDLCREGSSPEQLSALAHQPGYQPACRGYRYSCPPSGFNACSSHRSASCLATGFFIPTGLACCLLHLRKMDGGLGQRRMANLRDILVSRIFISHHIPAGVRSCRAVCSVFSCFLLGILVR